MSDNYAYAVVPAAQTLGEAYAMGYDRFTGADPVRADVFEQVDAFKQSASWANNVAPLLRSLSGYADEGHGTYQTPRAVVVVPDGNEDDLPRTGSSRPANAVYETVVDAWQNGAMDALRGRERGESAGEAVF